MEAANYGQAFRMAVVGSLVGESLGVVTETVADEILKIVRVQTYQAGRGLADDLINVFVRAGVAAVGFISANRVMRTIQGERADATEGILFTYFYVDGQPMLVRSVRAIGSRFRDLIFGRFKTLDRPASVVWGGRPSTDGNPSY